MGLEKDSDFVIFKISSYLAAVRYSQFTMTVLTNTGFFHSTSPPFSDAKFILIKAPQWELGGCKKK